MPKSYVIKLCCLFTKVMQEHIKLTNDYHAIVVLNEYFITIEGNKEKWSLFNLQKKKSDVCRPSTIANKLIRNHMVFSYHFNKLLIIMKHIILWS